MTDDPERNAINGHRKRPPATRIMADQDRQKGSRHRPQVWQGQKANPSRLRDDFSAAMPTICQCASCSSSKGGMKHGRARLILAKFTRHLRVFTPMGRKGLPGKRRINPATPEGAAAWPQGKELIRSPRQHRWFCWMINIAIRLRLVDINETSSRVPTRDGKAAA